MDLITIEGVYQNGRVELVEMPDGVERSRVMVTFLPDTEELPRQQPETTAKSGAGNALPAEPRYPQELRDEYKALVKSKLHRTLTPEESGRLESVRAEINRLDRLSASWELQDAQADKMDQDLTDLRRILEALPDA